MSRSWQYMGFNQAAAAILAETVKIGMSITVDLDLDNHPINTYTKDRTEPAYTRETYATHTPWYDESTELYIYRFQDGRILEGYVQAEPWSSGPMTFMALRDHETKEPIAATLWPDAQINEEEYIEPATVKLR